MNPFPNLPAITFSEIDPAAVRAALIQAYERITGRTLYPGNPERLFLDALSYFISLQNLAIDAAGKKNLLAYADGPHLDHLGIQQNTPRLDVSPAKTVLRFTLPEVMTWDVTILLGTRIATADQSAIFATDETLTIKAGELSGDVVATATTPGAVANGLVPGQVHLPVDPPVYYTKVVNITTTLGGADPEDDDAYRQRIHEAREAYTSAGPVGSYRYHAMRVHPDIADVAVWTPVPGTVDLRPILKDGEMPDEDILKAIREAVSAEDVRPLTDTVIVEAPVGVDYAITGGWYLARRDAALSGSIGAAVSTAVEQYRLWQRSKPGRDINPDYLQNLVKQAGAKRMVITSPDFAFLEPWQVARETTIHFEYLGLEDE
ncbi:baseplate J/gp47 family protein [Desulfosarcina sp. OttesenSCG-928-G10]|nr:baseplate J/gp47 family protein [Desulfosarcina sp. OttesenSCG-928-G10]MDL2321757.1 baseplate J/gp47 family protein [Desulfosarcina sp. OttesenSCG-928-B08]